MVFDPMRTHLDCHKCGALSNNKYGPCDTCEAEHQVIEAAKELHRESTSIDKIRAVVDKVTALLAEERGKVTAPLLKEKDWGDV
jgi:predicted ATP-dependent serine protease